MYSLPNGKKHHSKKLYIDMWLSLGDRLCDVLELNHPEKETFNLSGFDPDVKVLNKSRIITFPLDIALTIVIAHHRNLCKLHNFFWDDEHLLHVNYDD